MKTRKATKNDMEEVAKIYKDSFSEPPYNEGWTLGEARKKMRVFSKYCDIWVYESDGEIAGLSVINPHQWKEGEVIFREETGVKKRFRGKGVATIMMTEVFDFYRKKGYKTSIGIINRKAKSFGFIKKFGMKIEEDNLLAVKEL
jgi:L-amino acid N-acyltransferase YncA